MISVVRNLLSKYSLPTAYDLMRDTPTKENWKNILRESVNKVVEYGWRNDINEKTFLEIFKSRHFESWTTSYNIQYS